MAFFVVAGWIQSRPAIGHTTLEPRVVRLGPDPHSLSVGVAWAQDGYCVGELSVTAKETDSEIFVGAVTDVGTDGVCAGVGTAYDTAYADLALRAPLGGRRIIRSTDGKVLPVVGDTNRFIPDHPTAADVDQYGGLNDTPALGLKKHVHITDQAALQGLASQLDSLPPFPTGTMFCPMDDGSYYLVDFTYGADSVDYPMKVGARGCQGVYIFGLDRAGAWAGATSPDIVDTLASLVQS